MMTTRYSTWSALASSFIAMSIFTACQQLITKIIDAIVRPCWRRLQNYMHPYIDISFHEYPSSSAYMRNEAYATIESYLSCRSTPQATRLKGELSGESRSLSLSMEDYEEVIDEFNGMKVKWFSNATIPKAPSISLYPPVDTKKRYFTLYFHKKHRQMIIDQYLKHVMEEGKAIRVENRQRRLYTNNPSDTWWDFKINLWSHVVFSHPSRFETLAMDSKKKEEIVNDLITFTKGKDYYAKIGKAWKRGYLLYGPPGTGKSSMIAAMANFLGYNIYDIELTAVKNNSELRRLLSDIPSKSILVIEDIDCSLDLTRHRKGKEGNDLNGVMLNLGKKKNEEDEENDETSRVTLSGLLNFIDGLWSASGGERIIVFTTNHKEKLDPALIRRGRMDQHIEMSYCRSDAFKVLAKNYLDIDSHELFDKVGRLLEKTNMTPADVVEHLLPKTAARDVDASLKTLIQALETAGKHEEESRQKAEEEAKQKAAEEEAKQKAADEEAKHKAAEEEAKLKAEEEEAKQNAFFFF